MNITSLLNELRTIAQNGLYYTEDPYDRERYERLLELASQTYGEFLQISDDQVRARLESEIGPITPKVGADAAIFNEQGEILLMERVDGSGWCLPCGLVQVEVVNLVGIFTRFPGERAGLHTTIGIVYLCHILGGGIRLSGEGSDLQYMRINEVENWHPGHEKYARAAYKWFAADGPLLPVLD